MKRGKILLIEGTDRSGKQTQTDLLIDRFNREDIPCQKMSFPRYDTPTGRIVGQCYLGKELGGGDVAWFGDSNSVDPRIASMYYAADRLAAVKEMKKILNSGKNLILDRYIESNMAHQGGKCRDQIQRSKLIQFIIDLEYTTLKLPSPNGIIFLYMPFEIGVQLGEKTKEKADGHESNLEHLKNAEETYVYLARRFNWERVDCAPNGFPPRTPEDIHEEVYSHSRKILEI